MNKMHRDLFLKKFNYVLKHKYGEKNVVADALSMKVYLLTTLHTQITSFESLPELYAEDEDFGKLWDIVTTIFL